MDLKDKMMKLLTVEPDFLQATYLCEMAMKSNDINDVKAVLNDLKTRYDFALIRSYVGKFMEEEKVSNEEYEKYLQEFSKNCTACIDEYMKDDPAYQAFLEEKKHPKNIIKFDSIKKKKK